MVVNGLQIPLSITASHFTDVPRGHPAFKYIETLYDYSTQSEEPFFDFEQVMILRRPSLTEKHVTGVQAVKNTIRSASAGCFVPVGKRCRYYSR